MDVDVRKRLIDSWLYFAATARLPGTVNWPKYSNDKQEVYIFKGAEDDNEICDFFRLAFDLSK